MRLNITLLCFFLLLSLSGRAQTNFSFNGQYMNRAEYRHGYSTLDTARQDAAFFISQRVRLISSIKLSKAEIYMSIQDVRTWGSTPNLAIDNAGLLSVHEAWAALRVNKKFILSFSYECIYGREIILLFEPRKERSTNSAGSR